MRTYGPDYKLILVGDATMSPYEITTAGGSVEHWNAEPGEVWLQRLTEGLPEIRVDQSPAEEPLAADSVGRNDARAARGAYVPAQPRRTRRGDRCAAIAAPIDAAVSRPQGPDRSESCRVSTCGWVARKCAASCSAMYTERCWPPVQPIAMVR